MGVRNESQLLVLKKDLYKIYKLPLVLSTQWSTEMSSILSSYELSSHHQMVRLDEGVLSTRHYHSPAWSTRTIVL